MADSAQDRNLPASERKKTRAREDGQVPRSRDLGHFAALGVGGAALMVAAEPMAGWLQHMLASALSFDRRAVASTAFMTEYLGALVLKGMVVVLPAGLLMVLVAVGSALMAGGWNVSFKFLQPQFNRFDPISGIGRLFSKQHFVEVLKMCVLATVLGAVGYFYLKAQFQDLSQLLMVPLPQGIAKLARAVAVGFGLLLLVLGAWALIDVPLQRHLWLTRLKMTQQEVKQEHKDAEGNTEVKGKIKARMREMARRRMLAAVPKADLVVMNPTHYAVALKYDEDRMGAPRVVAKGADLLALRIRDIARESKVPVLQAPPLARALYTHCEIDGEVPAALFAAVAQVLAWVYQLRHARGPGMPPPQVVVPPGMDPHDKPPPRG